MIKWNVDMSQVAAFTGSTEGYLDSLETPIYLDDVLRIGHAKTKDSFNRAAAIYAGSTKRISHVFEWGAGGINSAPGTPTIDPLSPLARLWVHTFAGRAGKRRVDFEFRASRVHVPLPDPDQSGIDSDFLSQKGPTRRHFFFWKAPIMEYGMPVTIKPKYAKALFIPLGGGSPNPRNAARGYTMTSSAVEMVPGQKFAGMFTSFWEAWWRTEGFKEISLIAQEAANSDSEAVIVDSGIEAKRYTGGVQTKAYTLQASNARAKARMEMANRTKARRRIAAAAERSEIKDEVFKKGKKKR